MTPELQHHLAARAGEPKRILALDGGGVRGLVTLGILENIERLLAKRSLDPERFRLCHYYDLIAGTSTGALIATGLARGMSVKELDTLYRSLCPKIFNAVARGFWKPVYDYAPLEKGLKDFLGEDQLQSDKLKTGLLICAKRIDTGSPWVLTNNPAAKYWNSPDQRYRPNKEYELWKVVRASAAAPLYFEPVEVVINDGEVYERDVGLFVDGAVAGLNNPSLQAFLTATLPAYGFGWQPGKTSLLMTSLGTGWWRREYTIADFKGLANWRKATESLSAMINDTSLNTVLTMQALSEPRKPWTINSEVGTVAGHLACGAESLTFQRYDALVRADTVTRVFGLKGDTPAQMTKINALLIQLRELGNTDADVMKKLYALGHDVGHVTKPGHDGIEPEDFPDAFNHGALLA